MASVFTANNIKSLETLLAIPTTSIKDIVFEKPSVLACYANGGTGCSLTTGIEKIKLWWKAPGSSSISALPTWIKKDGANIVIDPLSLTEGSEELKAAIGTSYIFFKVDPLANNSKIYTDSSVSTLVASEGF